MAHIRAQAGWKRVAAALALVLGLACTSAGLDHAAAQSQGRTAVMSTKSYTKPTDAELKQKLTPEQYDVTQHEATERAFQNAYWNNHEPGLYVDVTTGEPLFASVDKFESGTGWPSFTQPIEPNRVVKRTDTSFGMARTEVRSKAGNAHLGHVFDDGPAPTHLRYCINSASLRFVPVAKLKDEGYAEYLPLFEKAKPSAAK